MADASCSLASPSASCPGPPRIPRTPSSSRTEGSWGTRFRARRSSSWTERQVSGDGSRRVAAHVFISRKEFWTIAPASPALIAWAPHQATAISARPEEMKRAGPPTSVDVLPVRAGVTELLVAAVAAVSAVLAVVLLGLLEGQLIQHHA